MKQYAVLLSCASQAVYGPELVCTERFTTARAAQDRGHESHAHGLEHEVMGRDSADEPWRDRRGRTAVEVIRARWQS